MNAKEKTDGYQNAQAWSESIAELAVQLAGGDEHDAQAAYQSIIESALEIAVRSDWHAPGSTGANTEFRILLTCGGPALQICGELDNSGEPARAWLQYQDWGTGWIDYLGGPSTGEHLRAFAGCFYFGE